MKSETKLLAVAAILYVLYFLYLSIGLGFEFLRSDVLVYWNDSYRLDTPFSTWFVPMYPLAIAVVRAITFDTLSPVAVMMSISCVFYLISVLVFYKLVKALDVKSPFEFGLLFAVYPFVGLTYAVHPIADSMAIALLLLVLLSFQKKNWISFTLFMALITLTHKATWFFVFPLLLLAFIKYKESRKIIPLAVVPLLTLIIVGAFYHSDILWFMRLSTEKYLTSRSAVPILDGVVGPMISGSLSKMMKGAIVFFILVITGVLFTYSYRSGFWLGVSVTFSILVMGAIVNQYEIWAMVRFSKVLLVPLAYAATRYSDRKAIGNIISPMGLRLLALVSLIANLGYGYYMAKIFFL